MKKSNLPCCSVSPF